MNCDCGKPTHRNWRCCKTCGDRLWALQDAYDERKRRCAPFHALGGHCPLCGYDILLVSSQLPVARA